MSTSPELVVARVFEAPREPVFRAWTEADHLARWWGPKGCEVTVVTLDLRPGGMFHYGLSMPNGVELHGRFIFREVARPERLVFVSGFADAAGGPGPNPWMPVWPAEVLNELTFAEEGDCTRMTLRGWPIDATEDERKAFADALRSMQGGWGGTLEKLADHLAAVA